ncbi:MAG: cob(I)yrinic acid a,c-diamide adenosyltransferase [Candidatus Thermoplasmatota archaeon]|nr:cob(I)yrinic acid a,c-diamide adenosyltransferase [Candidatus Thermoplasmatota archaeon]MBU1941008.1 cob(I)yrinic acid a,c-diamide adenosyltransferase [Candidatus Thermoplasmatota archaeon]
MPLEHGRIQIYTGAGKGKTTAAIGLGVRATGHGLKVYLIQFMKGRRYGELNSIEKLPLFTLKQFGRDEFVSKKNPEKIDIDFAQQGLAFARKIISEGKHDVIILDEINVALDYKLITLESVLQLLENKPKHVEIILTGRYAPPELVKYADLVSEICEIKHPYTNGVLSRKGIDW